MRIDKKKNMFHNHFLYSLKMSIRDRAHKNNNLAEKREKLIDDIQKDYEQNGEYEVSQVALKNIILVGRTRTGKSTIKSLLVNPTTIPEDLKLFSGTKSPILESFRVTGKNVTLNIIDTPGFVERGTDKLEARDNDKVLKIIDEYINHELTKCHVICFCLAITCGINEQDVQIIRLLLHVFGDSISSNSCLIITHCESKNEEDRARLKSELSEDIHFKELVSFFKLGIFFSGALNRDDYNTANDSLIDQFVAISEYRTILIEMFTSDLVPFPLDATGMSELRRAREDGMLKEKELRQAHEDLQQKLSILAKTKDELGEKILQLEDMQSTIEEHTRIIVALKEQSSTDRNEQEKLKALLATEEEKRRQTEEILLRDNQDHRLTEKELEREQQVRLLVENLLHQEEQARHCTEEKLQEEQQTRRLAEAEHKREKEDWYVRETELHKQYDCQVEAAQDLARRLQEVEQQRDEAGCRLNKTESLVDRLKKIVNRLLYKKSDHVKAVTAIREIIDEDVQSPSSNEVLTVLYLRPNDTEEVGKHQGISNMEEQLPKPFVREKDQRIC
jgi:GTP-binding protein EngB required for normal cell division